MAATTISYTGPLQTARSTLEATAANARQVVVARQYRKITITFLTSAEAADSGEVSYTGTDGAAMGTDAFPIGSGQALEITVPRQNDTFTFYVRASTASGFCQILLEA